MKKTLIVSGGRINKSYADRLIKDNNFTYIIAVDKGLEVLDELDILPSYIIGDFDSVDKELLNKYREKDIEIKELNPEKDYTDTHMGLRQAIEFGSDEIIIIGAIGTRMDHTIANIHVMTEALDKNISCRMCDEYSDITIINKDTEILKSDEYKYLSIIPLTTEVKGVTLEGFKYRLNNRDLRVGESIGISNEQIENKAIIRMKEGKLIVIKSRD